MIYITKALVMQITRAKSYKFSEIPVSFHILDITIRFQNGPSSPIYARIIGNVAVPSWIYEIRDARLENRSRTRLLRTAICNARGCPTTTNCFCARVTAV